MNKRNTKQLYGRTYIFFKGGFKQKKDAEQYLVDNQRLWTLNSGHPQHLHITKEQNGYSIYFSPKKGR